MENFKEMRYTDKVSYLWNLSCIGDSETLENIFDEYNSMCNVRYEKFGIKHSYIMAAYRNGNFDTVDLLIQIGGNIEEHEKAEIESYINKKRIEILEQIVIEIISSETDTDLIKRLFKRLEQYRNLLN